MVSNKDIMKKLEKMEKKMKIQNIYWMTFTIAMTLLISSIYHSIRLFENIGNLWSLLGVLIFMLIFFFLMYVFFNYEDKFIEHWLKGR